MQNTKVAAYDPEGFHLCVLSRAVADRYLADGQAVRHNRGIRLRTVRAVGLRELSPLEKRAIVLRKERAKK